MSTDNTMQINKAISTPINQIFTVASYIQRHNGDVSKLDDLAEAIVDGNYVRNLIIAPNGIVTQVFPNTADNHNVLGLDYFSDSSEGNREAVIAIQTQQILLAGPFTTVVGDQAISGRLPVFLADHNGNKVFWGLVCITLRYPEILEGTRIDNLKEQGITYELWHNNVDTNERQIILSNGVIAENTRYIDEPVGLLNAEWYLRLSPLLHWYEYLQTWAYLSVALFISVMMALLIKKNNDLEQSKESLETMVYYDPLTKLLNRQGLFSHLHHPVKKLECFQVNYIDLNRFKQINDKYGHATGDLVLSEFARRITRHIDDSYLFARMSGDEFILIVADTVDAAAQQIFWENISGEFETPITTDQGEDIYLTFCRGTAEYAGSESQIDSVISMADKQMYLEKNKQK